MTAAAAPTVVSLAALAMRNTDFRHVVSELSNDAQQVALMCVTPADGGGIRREVHDASTQTLYIVGGHGTLVTGAERTAQELAPGAVVVVQPGVEHEVLAEGTLLLYTTYVPPLHRGAAMHVARRADDPEE